MGNRVFVLLLFCSRLQIDCGALIKVQFTSIDMQTKTGEENSLWNFEEEKKFETAEIPCFWTLNDRQKNFLQLTSFAYLE